jgi:hypothetical protein
VVCQLRMFVTIRICGRILRIDHFSKCRAWACSWPRIDIHEKCLVRFARIHHPPDRRRFGVTLAFPSHEYHDFFLLLMYQLGCDDYITAFDEYHKARVASHVDEFDTLDAMVSQMTWMALVDMMHNFLFLFTVLITYLHRLLLGKDYGFRGLAPLQLTVTPCLHFQLPSIICGSWFMYGTTIAYS